MIAQVARKAVYIVAEIERIMCEHVMDVEKKQLNMTSLFKVKMEDVIVLIAAKNCLVVRYEQNNYI